jgi:hypothetical protein
MVSNIHILIVHTTLYNIQGDFIKYSKLGVLSVPGIVVGWMGRRTGI